MRYKCKNYRQNENGYSYRGSVIGHTGTVLADLYDEKGEFHRTAIVADCGDSVRAKKYCEEKRDTDNEITESVRGRCKVIKDTGYERIGAIVDVLEGKD